ncbi:hypothetical protein ACHHYP_20181 [Achlya hypogyna]|uniref:Secreted protein n=1 Tax=Achlya hypogyna TaxID=1202772 RepID=A0A1V9Z0R9_ACHHY|nr:hypothetical protein ACHHYP_20181 [Achlya hypogyna]
MVPRLLPLLVLLVAVFGAPPTTAPVSPCQRCAQSNDCGQAYQGSPGQFCGQWLNAGASQPCCCATGAGVCAIPTKRDACTCKSPPKKSTSPVVYVAIGGGVVAVLVGAFCCIKRRRAKAAAAAPTSPLAVAKPTYKPEYADTYARQGGLV